MSSAKIEIVFPREAFLLTSLQPVVHQNWTPPDFRTQEMLL